MKKINTMQMESLQGGKLPTVSAPKPSDFSCAEGYVAIAASLAGAVTWYAAVQKGYSCIGSWFD